MDKLSNIVACDICKKEFSLRKDHLKEQRTVLEKPGRPDHEVTITSLVCPFCGKSYVVTVDDDTTLEVLDQQKEVFRKVLKLSQENREAPEKLRKRQDALRRKLHFRRQKLAKRYNGSFYQTEDGKEQLDYRYHVR